MGGETVKSLIIGSGQVGTALKENIQKFHETFIRDVSDFGLDGVEVLHICYPDHEGFEQTTKDYIHQYQPKVTIIHSSVRVGTTKKCGENVVYSPVRGRHPNLSSEMKLFVKFIGGGNDDCRMVARDYLRECGFVVVNSNDAESLELFKVISNIHMGWEIAWRQEVGRILDHFGVGSLEYEDWERTYRDGYISIKDWNLMRSVMRPDPIGGHCILPCVDLLRSQIDSKALDFIIESNERVKKDSSK